MKNYMGNSWALYVGEKNYNLTRFRLLFQQRITQIIRIVEGSLRQMFMGFVQFV